MMQQHTAIAGEIDRASPEPYYMQLLRLVEAEIESGRYGVGDRLPSETDLCRTFELARSTVRETLRSLQDRGLIKMVPRRGAFVASQKPNGWLLQVAEGFFEEKVFQEHGKVETRVLSSGLQDASDEVQMALALPPGKRVYVIERVRSLDGKIAMYSVNYLLPELKPIVEATDVVSGHGSLNKVLRQSGYRIYGARREVEAVAADKEIAAKLKVPVGTPLLLVTSRSWSAEDRVFDHYRSWLRSDVVKVSVVAKAADS